MRNIEAIKNEIKTADNDDINWLYLELIETEQEIESCIEQAHQVKSEVEFMEQFDKYHPDLAECRIQIDALNWKINQLM